LRPPHRQSGPALRPLRSKKHEKGDVGELRKAAGRSKGLTYGSGGNGTVPHVAGTLLGSALGVEVTHIPFRGSGPAVTALISGQTDVLIESVPVVLGQIQDGSVHSLLVAAKGRDPLLPAVPTAGEAGLPNFEIENSYGMFAPARTPAGISDAAAAALRTGLAEPACSQRLREEMGIHPGAGDPASFGAYWRSELERWAPVVAASGVTMG
jgi:tripartite-type tricarboxylate transporter receptor subunit TctC